MGITKSIMDYFRRYLVLRFTDWLTDWLIDWLEWWCVHTVFCLIKDAQHSITYPTVLKLFSKICFIIRKISGCQTKTLTVMIYLYRKSWIKMELQILIFYMAQTFPSCWWRFDNLWKPYKECYNTAHTKQRRQWWRQCCMHWRHNYFKTRTKLFAGSGCCGHTDRIFFKTVTFLIHFQCIKCNEINSKKLKVKEATVLYCLCKKRSD